MSLTLPSLPPRAHARLHRHYWLSATAACAIGTAIAAAFDVPPIHALLALLLLAICVYPSFNYHAAAGTTVPAIPIFAGAFALQFAIPALLGDHELSTISGERRVSDESLTAALVIANLSFCVFLGCVYAKPVRQMVSTLPVFALHLNRTRALVFAVGFGAIGILAGRLLPSVSPEVQIQYGALFRVLQNQLLVAIVVLAWLAYTGNGLGLRASYYALVGAAVLTGLSSGFLEAVLVPIGLMFAAQWIFRRRISVALLALIACGMVFLNPAKGEYRDRVWFSNEAELSAPAKAVVWVDAAVDYWKGVLDGTYASGQAAYQLGRRTSMIDALAHVYELTPDFEPYLDGETYAYFAYSLVPRFVWPEKPTATANATLGVRYLLTTPEGAERSTFGISLLGEGYANFGLVGAMGIMAIMAVLILALQRMFATPLSGAGGYALFMAFFIFFLNGLGSSAEILLGNLLQSMLVSYVLMYWVTERPRRTGATIPRGA